MPPQLCRLSPGIRNVVLFSVDKFYFYSQFRCFSRGSMRLWYSLPDEKKDEKIQVCLGSIVVFVKEKLEIQDTEGRIATQGYDSSQKTFCGRYHPLIGLPRKNVPYP